MKAQLYIDTNKQVDDVNLSLPIGMGVRAHAATSIFQPLFFRRKSLSWSRKNFLRPGVKSRENCMTQSEDADNVNLNLQTIRVGVQEGWYDSVQIFNCTRLKLIWICTSPNW